MEKKTVSVELRMDDLQEFRLRNGGLWVRVCIASDTIVIETNARSNQSHVIGHELKRIQLYPGESVVGAHQRSMLDRRVEELLLSPHSEALLERLGAEYIGQLVQLEEEDFWSLKRPVKRALKELKEQLLDLDLSLNMKLDWWSPPTPPT